MKSAILLCSASALALLAADPASAASCEALAALELEDTTITSAQIVPAGQFTPPEAGQGRPGLNPYKDLALFCRVAATLRPTTDSDIKIELWLPTSNWNGKFQAVGNGGWAGVISYAAMAEAVRRGYASASTDTGHVGGRGTFALGHPEKLIDFDREGQGTHPGVLRQRPEALVLERLLDRRAPGPQGSADVSGGL